MRDKETPDYYRILGIPSTATDLEIKGRYRALSKQHHPDMGGSQTEMAQINEAYRALSDTFKRAIYDAERKRALHVPPRAAPTTSQATAAARRPAPRTQPQQFSAKPKHQPNWWARLAWGFAAAVIVIGLLMHLPIAEALGNDTADTQPTSKPLNVTYEPDTSGTSSSANTSSSQTTTPDTSTTETVAPSSTPVTPTTPQQKTCTTDSAGSDAQTCYDPSCDNNNCGQSGTKKNCITKSIGFYKHTICSAPSGTTSCSNSIGTTYRYTDCN